MKKVNKSLVIVGSAALAAAMTTLVSTAEAGKHHGGGFRPPSPPRLHRPGLHRDLQGGAQAGGAAAAKVAVIRYADGMRPRLRRGEQGLARRPEPLLVRQAGLDVQERRLDLWQLPLVRGGRHLAHQCAGGAKVRRLRDRSGVRRQDRAHGRSSQRAEGDRRGAESCAKTLAPPVKTAEKAPAEESAQLALPADGNAVRASECKKYFPSVGEMLPVPCTNDRSSL